jgi:hypothetical protein
VLHHAYCPGVRNQRQIKLQLSVGNRGDRPLDANIKNIRLLIPGTEMPPGWTTNGFQTTDWSVVSINDISYVAIPANANGAAEPYEPGYTTWASHWGAGTLEPGQPPYTGSGPNHADIVFYVPPASPDEPSGVAVVTEDGRGVLGYSMTPWSYDSFEPKDF